MSRGLLIFLLAAPAPAYAGVTQVFTDVGRYHFSVDGWGSSTSSSGSVTITKPTASSTLKYAYASVTTIPYAADPGASVLKVGGTAVTLSSSAYDQVYTRYGDITSTVESYFNALPAGANTVSLQETGISAGNSDGAALYIVWEDATLSIATVALSLGSAFTAYDPTITLAVAPVDTTATGFKMLSGVAISFSAGPTYSQKSDFYFGATRITTEAGGYDDGTLNNGALFTVGGDGDAVASELYNLTTYATYGATSLTFRLHGYSLDDYCTGIWVEATSVTATTVEYCGDGIVNGIEECDDANSDDTDGCSNLCMENCYDNDGDGYTADDCGGDDCDDSDSAVNPGAIESCNDIDDDCDGSIDERGALGESTWWLDLDTDGYGNPAISRTACDQPMGYVDNDDDCDDTNPDVHLGSTEIPYDGIDQDCDGTDLTDIDGDGYDGEPVGGTDCADEDASVHPGASETADASDEDCDGILDETTAWGDDDGDGVTEAAGDCDDADASSHPGTEETENGIDDDCNGIVDDNTDAYDDDGDGYSENDGDCNDVDPSVHPGAAEVDGNGVDDDCDGTVDDGLLDDDGDGYTTDGGDCEPDRAAVHPGAEELPNGVDDDCDGVTDEGTTAYDDDGDGQTEEEGDLDDTNPTVYSGAEELADGRDNDGDGLVDEGTTASDDDGDGYSEDGGDCDDQDATINPDAEDVSGNGIDENCSGDADENGDDADADGYNAADGDCDDNNGWAHPGLAEVCDGVDNNCDGDVDEGCDGLDTGKIDGAGECGCSATSANGAWVAMIGALALALRRRR